MTLFRRKNLISVEFIFDTSSRPSSSVESTPGSDSTSKKADEPLNPICPSCKKGFSNSTLMFSAYHNLYSPQRDPFY